MKSKIIFATLQILYIVCLSMSISVKNSTKIPDKEGEESYGDFVRNGSLLPTWSDNFAEFTENVKLRNLGIITLFGVTFAKFLALRELDLSSNKLVSTLDAVAALKTARALSINMSNNNLGSPEYDWPDRYEDRSYKQNKTILLDSKYFWSIDISHNSLVGIGIDFDVAYLNLSNNQIRCHSAIEPRQFSATSIYVGNLDLSHNLINCQTHFFTSYIDTLDMSYNKLGGLDAGIFEGLNNLTALNLEHNNIRYIHPRAFLDNFNLQNLILNSNRIAQIYKQVWLPTGVLQNIDLSSNILRYLDWDMAIPPKNNRIRVNIENNSNVRWSIRSENYFRFSNALIV